MSYLPQVRWDQSQLRYVLVVAEDCASLEGGESLNDSHTPSVLHKEQTRTSPTPTPGKSNAEIYSSAQPTSTVRKLEIIDVIDMSKLSCLSRCRNENDDLTFSSFGRVAVVDYSTTATIDLTHEEEPGHDSGDYQTEESLLTIRDVSTRLPQDVGKEEINIVNQLLLLVADPSIRVEVACLMVAGKERFFTSYHYVENPSEDVNPHTSLTGRTSLRRLDFVDENSQGKNLIYKYEFKAAVILRLKNGGLNTGLTRRCFIAGCKLMFAQVITDDAGESSFVICDRFCIVSILTSRCKDSYLALTIGDLETGQISFLDNHIEIRMLLQWCWSAPAASMTEDQYNLMADQEFLIFRDLDILYDPSHQRYIDIHSIKGKSFPPKKPEPNSELRNMKWVMLPGASRSEESERRRAIIHQEQQRKKLLEVLTVNHLYALNALIIYSMPTART